MKTQVLKAWLLKQPNYLYVYVFTEHTLAFSSLHEILQVSSTCASWGPPSECPTISPLMMGPELPAASPDRLQFCHVLGSSSGLRLSLFAFEMLFFLLSKGLPNNLRELCVVYLCQFFNTPKPSLNADVINKLPVSPSRSLSSILNWAPAQQLRKILRYYSKNKFHK